MSSLWASLRLLFQGRHAVGLWLVNLVNVVDSVAYFGTLSLMTVFLSSDIKVSDQLSGMTVSVYTGLVTLTMFLGGFLCDRLGVRRTITLALLMEAVGRSLLASAPLWLEARAPAAWTGLSLAALGAGLLQPALYAAIKQQTDSETATLGYSFLYSTMMLGLGLGAMFSPFVRTDEVLIRLGALQVVGLNLGIAGVFWVGAGLTWLILGAQWLLYRPELDPPGEASEPSRWRLSDLPIWDAKFIFFISVLLPVRTLFAHWFLTLPLYVFRVYPEAVSNRFEWLNGLNSAIVLVLVPLVAAATRRVPIVDMMILGTSVSVLSAFLLLPSPSAGLLIAFVVVFSLGESLWGSRFFEYVADIAPPGKVGAYMGLAGLPWFLAKFTTGLYSGGMLNRFVPEHGPRDPGTLWLIYGCFALLSPVGLVLARKWLLLRKEPVCAHPL
ncbi:MAG: MFS transporter [Armatimonadetes bacterium]|nr:MFS transporter [Armatimonadota bacterium]